MGDRCGSDTGFVGECCPLEALDQGTDKTAGNTQAGKGAGKDLAEGPADLVVIDQKNDQGRTDIKNTHERHHLFGDIGYRLDTPDNHREDHGREHDPCNPAGIVTDNSGNLRMCLVRLEHVAAAECAENAEDREKHRQELAARKAQLFEPFGDVIHRTARNRAVLIFVSVFDPECAFGELRCHAEQSGKDHPECRARPADSHGDSHAGDVAKPDSARKRGRQSLEVADFTCIVGIRIIALHQADGVPEEPELHESEVEREDRSGDNQPHDDPGEGRSRDRRKDEIDERAGHRSENLVDLLVKRHRFLGACHACHPCCCNRQQHDFFEIHHGCPLN